MSRKFVVCIAGLMACLLFCQSNVAPAQDKPSSGSGQEAVVTDWVKNILARGCPAGAPQVTQAKEPFPDSLEQLLDAWLWYSKFWRYVYYAVSVGTILFGALAAALGEGDRWFTKWKTTAALLATLIAGINTTFAPHVQFTRFDDAFAVFNSTKLSYLTNPSVTLCDVGKAVLYGESIIHKDG